MTLPLCTACGRRPATYKRRASGEVLCLRCLERALAKALRRGLASLASPKYGSRLAFIPLHSSPIASSGTAYLLATLAKRYKNDILVVGYPDIVNVVAEIVRNVIKGRIEVIHVNPRTTEHVPGPVSEARIIAESVKELKETIAVTPITATDILLDSLIRLMVYGMKPCECALPRYLVEGIVVVSPMSRVLLTDINAYVALSGIPVAQPRRAFMGLKGADKVKNLVAELERRSPETIYRFVKFLEAVLLSNKGIPQNGGFSPSL